jgi:two-component system OmpR family response regulator
MILIVEDDSLLATQIASILAPLCSQGSQISIAPSLAQAYKLLEQAVPDVIILDRMLGDGDGLELLEYLVESELPTRVLMLSRVAEVQDRIRGLERGADDYLAKPFAATELLLKTKLLLARKKELFATNLRLGPVQLDPDTGELTAGKKVQIVRRREAQIIACLFRYKNQVLSREKIISHVWGMTAEIPTYSTLDVYIRRIRIALGEYQHLLETIRGFGYRAVEG